MKSIKITMGTLAVTAALVIAFAFTSKPFNTIDAVYGASKKVTLKTTSPATFNIISSQLKVDGDANGVPDNWSVGSTASHVSGAPKLLGMEYSDNDYATLLAAATAIFNYYDQAAVTDLPADAASFVDINASTKSITVFRQN